MSLELLQQIGLLKVQCGGSAELFRTTTAVRVFKDLYEKLERGDTDQVELLKRAIVHRLSEYIKTHPRATEDELVAEVRQAFADFESCLNHLKL